LHVVDTVRKDRTPGARSFAGMKGESRMSDKLTVKEKSVLVILMAEGREIPNTLLTQYRTELDKASRDKLAELGLITVRSENNRIYLDLTDRAWKECLTWFDDEVPARAGAPGGALYALLGVVKRHLDRTNTPLSDFFAPEDRPAALPAAEIEVRVRAAYASLTREPGGWVGLADLRDRLLGLERTQVDAVLVAMNRTRPVRIVPESNQVTLSERELRASVVIGGQHRHMLAIEP
jgi:hypothetical protein